MPSIKKNILFSSLLTIASYIFPLITFPYISRVLGVANIGLCGFVDSIINYFSIFAMMGTTLVGIRTIAASKDNRTTLSHKFSSIIALNGITTLISVISLFVATIFVAEFNQNKTLLYLGAFKILFTFLLIEWLYTGLEDFKYITIRSLIIRSLYVIAILIFVKKPSDITIYYGLSVATVAFNAAANLTHSKLFTSFSLKEISIKPLLPQYLTLGAYAFLTSMYTTFNVTYLGFVTDDVQVGYYTTASKLYAIFLAFFSALTGVLLPRMTNLVANKNFDTFRELLKKCTDILFSFAIPIIVFIEIFAPEVILIISGSGYEGAITPMRIVIPLIAIIGYEQVLVTQALMPLKKDTIIFRNSCLAAILAVVLNLLLVSKFMVIGSCVIWVTCELLILLCSQFYVSKEIRMGFVAQKVLISIGQYVPLGIILASISIIDCNWIMRTSIGVIVTSLYSAFIILYVNGQSYSAIIVKQLLNKFSCRHAS